MTILSSSDDDLLDVDTMMETILLDEILYDVLVEAANFGVLLLVDYPDAIHDVDLDPNIHDEVAHGTTLLLNILHDDSTLLMLDEVVQKCCIQSDVEVHGDDHPMSTRSPLDSRF